VYCVSESWDPQDGPEECPVCKAPNFDEDTEEWACPAHEGFCSKACADKYEAQNAEEARAEAIDRLREPTYNEECDAEIEADLAALGFTIPSDAEIAKAADAEERLQLPRYFTVGAGAPKTLRILDMAREQGYTIHTIKLGPGSDE